MSQVDDKTFGDCQKNITEAFSTELSGWTLLGVENAIYQKGIIIKYTNDKGQSREIQIGTVDLSALQMDAESAVDVIKDQDEKQNSD